MKIIKKQASIQFFFGTKEGLYITVTGDSIKECFEKAIAQYDQEDSPSMIYQKIRSKLSQDVKNVSPGEARFFLEYFKDHIHEEDFELAADAQNILGK